MNALKFWMSHRMEETCVPDWHGKTGYSLEGKQVMKHRVRTGDCLTRYFYCGSVKEAAKCSQNRMIGQLIKNELRITWKK